MTFPINFKKHKYVRKTGDDRGSLVFLEEITIMLKDGTVKDENGRGLEYLFFKKVTFDHTGTNK